MKQFKKFELSSADLVFGGDLVVTWARDIYDTDKDIIIYIPDNF